MKQYLICW